MLRLPRTNPRPQGLQQNPSGLAVAFGLVALGATGGVGYLLYRVKAASAKLKAEMQAALGTVYVLPTEIGLIPMRILPRGGVEVLKLSAPDTAPTAFEVVGYDIAMPNSNNTKGVVFAEALKAAVVKEDTSITINQSTSPFVGFTAPGKLKVLLINESSMRTAFEGLNSEGKVDADFVWRRVRHTRIVKDMTAKRQKLLAAQTSQNKGKSK